MTEIKIARPGDNTTQGVLDRRLRASLIMLPHSAVGGFAPRPRKLSPASSIIMVPISSIDVTRMGPMMFGRICLKMIFQVPLPESFAALSQLIIERFCLQTPAEDGGAPA